MWRLSPRRTLEWMHQLRNVTLLGSFEHDLQTDVMTWSDQMFRIHGYQPDSEEPSLDLILSHKHPDALESATTMTRQAHAEGLGFSHLHRITDAGRRERVVLSFGEVDTGAVGDRIVLTRVRGYMADLSDWTRTRETTAVLASAAGRATIEQAKGILMATYAIDADAAFAFLRRWSQDHNVRVADVAEAIVEAGPLGSESVFRVLETLGTDR